jgi:hypothetical protein
MSVAKQPNADPLMVDYLFHVAQSVLTLHHSIPDGKTMDSPQNQLKIEQSGVPGRRTLRFGSPASGMSGTPIARRLCTMVH